PGRGAELAEGPRSPEFPDFDGENMAIHFSNPGWIEVPDAAEFRFDQGDEITIEAWVNPETGFSSQGYIIGKGRTYNPGFPATNQNWGFRLRQTGAGACVNFLFRSRKNGDHPGDWHRWTSKTGFAVGSGWHHVAMSYQFGDPKSIRGFLDGREVKGTWDMGGATTQPPVVDDDQIWIGSAMKGDRGNSFRGEIDEIALYRRILPPEELKARWKHKPPPLKMPELVDGKVSVQLFGPLASIDKIPSGGLKLLTEWTQDEFGFSRLPHRYNEWGVREDWGKTCLVRAWSELQLPAGKHDILVRSRGMSRLWIDGKMLVTTRKQPNRGGAHHKVDPLPEVPRVGMRPAAMNDDEKLISFTSTGGTHRILWEVVIGGPKYRLEFGETCLSIAQPEEMFRILGRNPTYEVTDEGWTSFRADQEVMLDQLDAATRWEKGASQNAYWAARHTWAREQLEWVTRGETIDHRINQRIAATNRKAGAAEDPTGFHAKIEPLLAEHCYRCHGEKEKGGLNLQIRELALQGGDSEFPAIVPGKPHESFLMNVVGPDAGDDKMPPKGEGLSSEQIATLGVWIEQGAPMPEKRQIVEVTPVVDDAAFLRRVYLDTVGVVPTLAEAKAFLGDQDASKRHRVVRDLLDDPRWADNWVGYWQDALAENPNLLKPNLNNTGPFRFWIYEALLDNKPMDRFATELMMMRGSTWGGGPAGFSIASQNDVPMAAKAHVIGSAFLGVEMKCARCHDAPYHEWTQGDLFQMAAMLDRKTLAVPQTSTVPAAFFEANKDRKALIEVTLKEGAKVAPEFPFNGEDWNYPSSYPQRFLQNPNDTREQLAADVTTSWRFARVIANRVWARYMGAGIVDPVDDWEGNAPSDPELLVFLQNQFILDGYDLKKLAFRILTSDAYQREAIEKPVNSPAEERFFQAPYRRRMSAEQIVDTAFHAAGQEMRTEELTMDIEGTLDASRFLNFGYPQRAWEFTTLANERDRPSLAIPRAQAVADVLKAFGWRNSRPEPSSHREEDPNLIQPGVLANGVLGTWLTRLSDQSDLTTLARDADTVESLVDDLFLQILTRHPSEAEKAQFIAMLEPGFENRNISQADLAPAQEPHRFRYVSWSNHLNTEANTIKVAMEAAAREGDPPTRYLQSGWREQMEDAVWALLNSPEMVMIP
ncbi:MAG: DUF1553 domain-containing protein, partial [Verrucomicrobiota bacterium]